MTTLVSALDTEFTPAAGPFNVDVPSGVATLLRKVPGASTFSVVQSVVSGAHVCDNDIGSTVYKFTAPSSSTVVQADQ